MAQIKKQTDKKHDLLDIKTNDKNIEEKMNSMEKFGL
jgi:hypothetical protein